MSLLCKKLLNEQKMFQAITHVWFTIPELTLKLDLMLNLAIIQQSAMLLHTDSNTNTNYLSRYNDHLLALTLSIN